MNTRIRNLISTYQTHKIDAFLSTFDVNITYLTQYPSSDAWLLVCPKEVYYLTDARYTLEVKKNLKGVAVKEFKNSLIDETFIWARKNGVKRLGFEARYVSYYLFQVFKKYCPQGIQLVPTSGLVENLREIKDRYELQMTKACLKLNLKLYDYIQSILKPGLSERNILEKIKSYVSSKGAGFSFDPIVATGEHSCLPHAKITDRKIKKNDVVLVDVGIEIAGYKSDLTRVFFLGKIPPHVIKVAEKVKESQLRAIKKIRPGVPAKEIDLEARNYLKEHNLSKYFTHSLGHGVGLEIHEGPPISQRSPSVIKEGMIFTVEPGVYFPNQFGVRIEDMVYVTKDGCEVLSF